MKNQFQNHVKYTNKIIEPSLESSGGSGGGAASRAPSYPPAKNKSVHFSFLSKILTNLVKKIDKLPILCITDLAIFSAIDELPRIY